MTRTERKLEAGPTSTQPTSKRRFRTGFHDSSPRVFVGREHSERCGVKKKNNRIVSNRIIISMNAGREAARALSCCLCVIKMLE